jgi:DNA-binding MarR family transcriptional regulator
VNNLLGILGVTKQSLNRVLRTLVEDGLVESRVGTTDKRERHLHLTEAGKALERKLSMRSAPGCGRLTAPQGPKPWPGSGRCWRR